MWCLCGAIWEVCLCGAIWEVCLYVACVVLFGRCACVVLFGRCACMVCLCGAIWEVCLCGAVWEVCLYRVLVWCHLEGVFMWYLCGVCHVVMCRLVWSRVFTFVLANIIGHEEEGGR